VAARESHRVLDRLGAAVGEEHHVEVAGRQLGDEPRASLRMSFAWNGAIVHSRAACSWIAATSFGMLVPMLTFTSWLEKSSHELPLSSHMREPWRPR
jgi:hypothetical protein